MNMDEMTSFCNRLLKLSSWTKSSLDNIMCSMRSHAVSVNVVDFNNPKQWAIRGSKVDNARLQSGSRIDNCRKITIHDLWIRIASAYPLVLWIISILYRTKKRSGLYLIKRIRKTKINDCYPTFSLDRESCGTNESINVISRSIPPSLLKIMANWLFFGVSVLSFKSASWVTEGFNQLWNFCKQLQIVRKYVTVC